MVTIKKLEILKNTIYSLSLRDIARTINSANNNYDYKFWQAVLSARDWIRF